MNPRILFFTKVSLGVRLPCVQRILFITRNIHNFVNNSTFSGRSRKGTILFINVNQNPQIKTVSYSKRSFHNSIIFRIPQLNRINLIKNNYFIRAKRVSNWTEKVILQNFNKRPRIILRIPPYLEYAFSFVLLDNEKLIFPPPTTNLIQNVEIISEKPIKTRKLKSLLNKIMNFLSEYVTEPINITCRFIYLLLLFIPLITLTPALLIGSRDIELDNERTGALWWYDTLVRVMETAGPTFIKLGQWAASRTDIFPQEMCNRLSKLHSAVNPHPFEDTKRIIEEEFKRSFHEVFSTFEKQPIGIGAIAQVYKATIRSEIVTKSFFDNEDDPFDHSKKDYKYNNTVAVKVLHPRAEKAIHRDLKILMVLSKIINAIPTMKWLSLPEEVTKFGEMMHGQLDLHIEAENLLEFRKNFKSRRSVKFPKPIMEYTTKNVLIEEFEEGFPIQFFLEQGGGIYDHMISYIGLHAFLVKSSDLSFNEDEMDEERDSREALARLMRYRHDKKLWSEELLKMYNEGYQPKVIFIDTGLVTKLNLENRRNFLDLFRAVAEFDGYRAGKLMIERCKTPDLVIDGEIFSLKMQHLVLKVKTLTLQLGKIRISDILTTVLTMVRNHHVKLEGDFINVIISILLLEGIGRQLDPQMDLLSSALPILRKLGTKEGGKGLRKGIKDPDGGVWWLKFWFWLEAREWVDNASWQDYNSLFEKQLCWPDI
ncbi:8907_t:CDS:2 [Diversispora eburnea]|uniref:8907_t:CDS:1 n=1 Tax=Diversispora eburnea TaxID=1213867 RepID=A0A9N8Z044_9GLOM|nr:8907_t:CDS:2 [Diversispora eburnea]